jgi:hypothetical protein
MHVTTDETEELLETVDTDLMPYPDADHFDLSQDPLYNERPLFDQDAYYDGFGEP